MDLGAPGSGDAVHISGVATPYSAPADLSTYSLLSIVSWEVCSDICRDFTNW